MNDAKHVESGGTPDKGKAARIRTHLWVAGILVLAWSAFVWLIAERYFDSRTTTLIQNETQRAEQQADIVTHNIDRDLDYLQGIPALLASDDRVRKSLLYFGPAATPSPLPVEQRKKRWADDATLNDLSHLLALTGKHLGADMIWVMNAAGDCIASSNADKADSFVGTNYADRVYFSQARQGRPGRQYAVGRKTAIPGLYFSFPVLVDDIFVGAVAVKRDLPNLAFWVSQADAFVTDGRGVIILARDPHLLMRVLPDASVSGLPEAEKLARYNRKEFAPLLLHAWGDPRHTTLQRLDKEPQPLVMASRKIVGATTDIFVVRRLPDIIAFEQERHVLFLLLAVIGTLLIATVSGTMLYLRNNQQARRTLAEHKKRLDEAQRITHVGSWELDLASGALFWSDEVYRIFEIDPTRFGASYEAFLHLVHPEERDLLDRTYKASLKSRQPYEITHRLQFPDGRVKHIQEHCETSYDDQGKPLRSIGVVQDITDRKASEQALRESEERFRDTLEYAPIGMATVSLEGHFLRTNRALCEIVGYTREELEQLTYQEITHPEDLDIDQVPVQQLLNGEIPSFQVEKRYLRKNGHPVWVQMTGSLLRDATGAPLQFIAQIEDITERKLNQESFRQLAYYDTLTGLPNRRLLMDHLNLAIVQAKHHQRALAVMFMDLDRFKLVNDTWGHDVGDELLRVVASRLVTCVRSGDTVSRQGGDEFVIVLSEIAHPQDAALVAENILKTLSEPIAAHEHMLQITVSIGIAIYHGNGNDDATELMKKADTAMYAAKKAGRNGYRFHDSAA